LRGPRVLHAQVQSEKPRLFSPFFPDLLATRRPDWLSYSYGFSVNIRVGSLHRSGSTSRDATVKHLGSEPGVMNSTLCKRLRRLGIGALLVLSFQVCALPRAAWAGCSHLVVSQSDRLLNFNRLDTLIVASPFVTSPTGTPEDLAPPVPGRRLPCLGPSCSSRTSAPLSTVSHGSDGLDQWGDLSRVVLDQLVAPAGEITDLPTPCSLGRKPSIFHPPPG
jgi:hypothetical protein